jgi:hypothetical protein
VTFALELRTFFLVAALLAMLPLPAWAYTCAISPAKDSVIVKTDNASNRAVTCKVDCTFKEADGPMTISCSQQIPAGAKGWYVCVRPTGGKALEFSEGSESCKREPEERSPDERSDIRDCYYSRPRDPHIASLMRAA